MNSKLLRHEKCCDGDAALKTQSSGSEIRFILIYLIPVEKQDYYASVPLLFHSFQIYFLPSNPQQNQYSF